MSGAVDARLLDIRFRYDSTSSFGSIHAGTMEERRGFSIVNSCGCYMENSGCLQTHRLPSWPDGHVTGMCPAAGHDLDLGYGGYLG